VQVFFGGERNRVHGDIELGVFLFDRLKHGFQTAFFGHIAFHGDARLQLFKERGEKILGAIGLIGNDQFRAACFQ